MPKERPRKSNADDFPDDPLEMMLRLLSIIAAQCSECSKDGLPVSADDILDDIKGRLKEGFVSALENAAELARVKE